MRELTHGRGNDGRREPDDHTVVRIVLDPASRVVVCGDLFNPVDQGVQFGLQGESTLGLVHGYLEFGGIRPSVQPERFRRI